MPWLVKERDLKRAARRAEGRGRGRKATPEQKTKQHQKLESKQKHENEKDTAPNQDKGKEPRETRATARQKPKEGEAISARIKGRDVRIPHDQQCRLDRGDSWLPAGPGQSADTSAARAQEPRPKTMGLVSKEYDALGL